ARTIARCCATSCTRRWNEPAAGALYDGARPALPSRSVMRIPAALAVLFLFSHGTALAECTRPRPDFQIPEGSGASEQELTALQGKLIGFAEEVREYLRCLNGDLGQRSIGKDEATRAKIAQE